VATNLRALKILPPGIKLPPMKTITVIAANGFGPEVASNDSPVVESKKYGEEIRLPSAREYDVLWVPEHGRSVYLLSHYAIKERKPIEIKPEDYLGLVRVGGSGLPKPRIVAVTGVGAFGPDVLSNFNSGILGPRCRPSAGNLTQDFGGTYKNGRYRTRTCDPYRVRATGRQTEIT
jgi:hypothetical protein